MKWGFIGLTKICALGVGGLLFFLIGKLLWDAQVAIGSYGLGFLVGSDWNAVKGVFGILPPIYGTVMTSVIALGIAVPIAVGVGILLGEPGRMPPPVAQILVAGVELLAAIPSVVYGLWGIFVVIPTLTPLLNWLHQKWGMIPIFSTPFPGRSLLVAALILAVMILPTIAAISRSVIATVPLELRLGALALGATPWETSVNVVLPQARSGIGAAILLALGRALGETMAVTMVIGNANVLSPSWLAPADTIASLLANNFAEAQDHEISALMYGALVLMAITLTVNVLAEWIATQNRSDF